MSSHISDDVLFCLIYLFCLSGFLLLPKKSNNCPRMQQKKICINKSLPFKSIVNSSWKHTSKIQMGIKHCSTNFNNFIFFIEVNDIARERLQEKKKDKGFIDVISDSENESKAKPYSKKGVNMHFTENISATCTRTRHPQKSQHVGFPPAHSALGLSHKPELHYDTD